MSCPICINYRSRSGRQYCPNCKQKDPVRVPDKTVLIIRAPKEFPEEQEMYEKIRPFILIKPLRIFTSTKPEVVRVVERMIAFFKLERKFELVSSLAPAGRINPQAIQSLIPRESCPGLFIFFTHEPHVKRAYEGYRDQSFRCLITHPEILPGEVICANHTFRTLDPLKAHRL